MQKGYTGISFPFRIGNKGGVVLSSTSRYEVPHIIESIIQILGTVKKERVMEMTFGSDVMSRLFDPNDEILQNLLRYQILDILLTQEPRILVKEEDIQFIVNDSELFASINFEVISYHTMQSTVVKIGGESIGE